MIFKLPPIAISRFGIGLVHGLLLLGLYQALQHDVWPSTNGMLYASLLAVGIFIPTLVVSGIGNLRPVTLAIWAAVAAVLCAGLAAYDIFREPIELTGASPPRRFIPGPATWWSLAAILFIVHTMTVAGEADRRVIANYASHFDTAWKHAVQVALAGGFVGVLWLLLFLGAELFRLIHLEFFGNLIRNQSFSIPVTAVTFDIALHITDARASIVRGTRTLLLILMSWLLPLMVLIGAGFIVALAFTGLDPLWRTNFAASLLLGAAAALVVLINATHQDGRPEHRLGAVLGYAKVTAVVVILPLVALAGYALALRIVQHGWTPLRIIAVAATTIGAFYAIGYAIAVGRSRQAMTALETTNIVTSLVLVGILIALTTPIADPARISVNDQVRRLELGKIAPEQFDFAFLRFNAASFGTAALERLAGKQEGPNSTVLAQRASAALKAYVPGEIKTPRPLPIGPEERARNIVVVAPRGAALPAEFLTHDWGSEPEAFRLPSCLTENVACEAILTDLDGDERPEIVLLMTLRGYVFKADDTKAWRLIGTMSNVSCGGVRGLLAEGKFVTEKSQFNDLVVGGQRLRVLAQCETKP